MTQMKRITDMHAGEFFLSKHEVPLVRQIVADDLGRLYSLALETGVFLAIQFCDSTSMFVLCDRVGTPRPTPVVITNLRDAQLGVRYRNALGYCLRVYMAMDGPCAAQRFLKYDNHETTIHQITTPVATSMQASGPWTELHEDGTEVLR